MNKHFKEGFEKEANILTKAKKWLTAPLRKKKLDKDLGRSWGKHHEDLKKVKFEDNAKHGLRKGRRWQDETPQVNPSARGQYGLHSRLMFKRMKQRGEL